MYEGQFRGEFVCGYWGLKGERGTEDGKSQHQAS